MRRLLMLLVPLVLLVAAPPALAGGWATVGLSSTPAGTPPGQPWDVDITVLQHGRTPLEGVTPTVYIRSDEESERFTAEPTGKPGVYSARVVFPEAGRWSYEVRDGFISNFAHKFPAVEIGGGGAAVAPARAPDDGGIAAGWLVGAGAALLLALALLGFARRGRAPEPAM